MKTIFIKYNRERQPVFQTATKIVEINEFSKIAIKDALLPEAIAHIHEMYHNYQLLKDKYKDILLSKPTLTGDSVVFEIVPGISLEKILRDAVEQNDKSKYIKVIQKYIDYTEMFVSQRHVKFSPSAKFYEIFGEWNSDNQEDIVDIANVDMTFGNLFLHGDEIYQIDYEWVFAFPIPKSFLLWRSIYVSFICYKIGPGLVLFDELLELIGCSEAQHQEYLQIDANFQAYVYGHKKQHLLNGQALKPQINLYEINTSLSERELKVKIRELLAIINDKNMLIATKDAQILEKEVQILERAAQILEKDAIILNLSHNN